jgi:hypothetical protein
MAFNSDSYYRNKWRRQALEELTEARQIKASGHSWKTVESAVRYARSSWRLYLGQARICELSSRAAPYRPAPFSTRLKESPNASDV